MSISRRFFVKAATIAAVTAGLSLKPSIMAVAQEIAQSDPLSFYTQSTFVQYINSVFQLRGLTVVDVILEKVEDTLPATVSRTGGRESFILFFRGGSKQLPQDTYTMDHPALGTFQLFLVPSGPDENGAQGYTATVNRLAYAAKPDKAPRKSLGTKSTGDQAPQAGPDGPPVESPEPQADAPARTPRSKDPVQTLQPETPSQTVQPEVPLKRPKKRTSPDRFNEI